jgi:hypothetical protein
LETRFPTTESIVIEVELLPVFGLKVAFKGTELWLAGRHEQVALNGEEPAVEMLMQPGIFLLLA